MTIFRRFRKRIDPGALIPILLNHQMRHRCIWVYVPTAVTGKHANIQNPMEEFGIARSTVKVKRSFYFNTDIFER